MSINKIRELLKSTLGKSITIGYLPPPFNKMALKAIKVNGEIDFYLRKIKENEGNEAAAKILHKFRAEAESRVGVNSNYIINFLKEYCLKYNK